MASLQDQLLKAGLTTKQKARQANTDKKKKQKQKRSGAKVDMTMQEQVKQDLAKQQAQKQAKDAELNAQRKQELADKEHQQRLLQILEHHHLKEYQGEEAYNYTAEGKVKTLYLDGKTHQAVVNGRLALCGLNDKTYVVTKETAEKLRTLQESVVYVCNEKAAQDDIDEDDPYAEFQIPDDLMW